MFTIYISVWCRFSLLNFKRHVIICCCVSIILNHVKLRRSFVLISMPEAEGEGGGGRGSPLSCSGVSPPSAGILNNVAMHYGSPPP